MKSKGGNLLDVNESRGRERGEWVGSSEGGGIVNDEVSYERGRPNGREKKKSCCFDEVREVERGMKLEIEKIKVELLILLVTSCSSC